MEPEAGVVSRLLGGTDQETTTALIQESGLSLKQEGGVAIRNQQDHLTDKPETLSQQTSPAIPSIATSVLNLT